MGIPNKEILAEIYQKLLILTDRRETYPWSEENDHQGRSRFTFRMKSTGGKMVIDINHKKGSRVEIVEFFPPNHLVGNRFTGFHQKFTDWLSERNRVNWKKRRNHSQTGGNEHAGQELVG